MNIVVLGGGMAGMTAAMLLAKEGHQVTLVDRDPATPAADAEGAWEQWRRPGVNQFRHPHIMLPGGYQVLVRELPEAIAELKALGAAHHNMLDGAWDLPAIGGRLPGDEQFDTLAARRPVIEAALGNATARTAGVTVRRGTPVTGFVTDGATQAAGVPRIAGVLTGDGETIPADLVVDALGRNSPVGAMLTDIGATAPIVDKHETGFLAYSRYFRSTDGSMPAQAGWPLDHHDSIGITTVPGDAGTWALALFVSARDRALRALSDPDVWQRVAESYPNTAHWATYGEPITGVLAMSGMESRYRRFVVDGRPVATGVLSIGDAWATTNPTFGMGITMAMSHALLLRDVLREVGSDDAEKLALRFDEVTNATLAPIQQASAAWDLHRIAQIDAEIASVPYGSEIAPYETDDPDWVLRQAVEVAKLKDPDVLRGFGALGSGLRGAEEVLTPELVEKIVELGSGAPRYPEPGLSRGELLTLLAVK